MSFLFTWVYINTKGSTLSAFLFHTIFNISGNFVPNILVFEMNIYRIIWVDYINMGLLWVLVAIVLLFKKKDTQMLLDE